MLSVHKKLSVAYFNAYDACQNGLADFARIDLDKAIKAYDIEISDKHTRRHYPTYAKATAFLRAIERMV